MTKLSAPPILLVAFAAGLHAQKPGPGATFREPAFTENVSGKPVAASLLDVKRIYVAELTGGGQADALRALIIASLDSTKLFILTDNEDHADAILKGAADDHTFTDSFDSDESLNARENGGKTGNSSLTSAASGAYGALSMGENESHHIRERKHEAYAALRLCNRDGDVLWSTSQESLGAKFHGASADVAAKVARQLTLDVSRARRAQIEAAQTASVNPSAAKTVAVSKNAPASVK